MDDDEPVILLGKSDRIYPTSEKGLSDQQIFDEFLKEKGTSRAELEAKILLERKQAKEQAERERKAARQMEAEERERKRDEMVREHYGSLLIASIDGYRIDDVTGLRTVPCPYCAAPLPELRDNLILSAQMLAGKLSDEGCKQPAKSYWTIHKDLKCPKCGYQLDLVTATISPEARELFGIRAQKE